jgi:hypothetical protein
MSFIILIYHCNGSVTKLKYRSEDGKRPSYEKIMEISGLKDEDIEEYETHF